MATQCEDRTVLPHIEELVATEARIQERLDEFQIWYNEHRVHGAHRAHTPDEQSEGIQRNPVRYNQRGGKEPAIQIDRQSTCGDLKLFRLDIKVKEREKAA